MSNVTPFLMALTMIAAFGAATVSQAQPQTAAQHASASLAELRVAAGQASTVEPGVLVLAAR